VRTLARIKGAVERLLQSVLIVLMVTLTAVVVVAVIYRKAGASLAWYDEVASILLAWVTYYGGALAALKRGHLGFDGLVRAMAPTWRRVCGIVAEICFFGFFLLLTWTGWVVLQVLEGDTLVSLPEVSVQITQSVIPIGGALFVLCHALSLPEAWRRLNDDDPGDGDGEGREGASP
jgi:TRAP-type C4-dicarboxylate transport system permease small subunit